MFRVSLPEVAATPPVRALRTKVGMVLTAGVVVGVSLVAMQASSDASVTKTLPKSLAGFAHCPVGNPKVTSCLYASTGGSFQVGKASLTLPGPAVLTLGLINTAKGVKAVAPTDGTPPLVAPTSTIPVLGGLLQVGATPTLAAVPTLSVPNLLTGQGIAITLPLVVDLSNPLLGSSCTLGTTNAPLVVNLTAGTTDPPAPNMPVTGSKGTLTSTAQGVLTISGASLVDNAFAAPGASGCGLLGIEDGLVNGLEGLPSAAGTNAAALSGDVHTAPATLIRKYLG